MTYYIDDQFRNITNFTTDQISDSDMNKLIAMGLVELNKIIEDSDDSYSISDYDDPDTGNDIINRVLSHLAAFYVGDEKFKTRLNPVDDSQYDYMRHRMEAFRLLRTYYPNVISYDKDSNTYIVVSSKTVYSDVHIGINRNENSNIL